MIKDTLKVTLRGALNRRTFTLINVVGLTVGLTAFILIALYVLYERSYDKFYPDSERIHRGAVTSKIDGQTTGSGLTPSPLANEAVEYIEGVEKATRILHTGYPVIRANGKAISEELFFRVDSNFFEIFPQRVIAGDDVNPLGEMGEMAITESAAIRYFGSAENAVGKIMTIDHMYDVRVTAVLADPPLNTHFQFEFLLQNDAWKIGDESWFHVVVP